MRVMCLILVARLFFGCTAMLKRDSQSDKRLNEAFLKAVKACQVDEIRGLLAKGADVNAKETEKGDTALHYAAVDGNTEIANILVANGADINMKDNDGNTALHRAVLMDYKEMVKLLIAAGADINAQCNYGWTPLQIAATYGPESVARVLLENGAKVDLPNSFGETPLHNAVFEGDLNIAQLLLNKGANVNAKDNEGCTSLDVVNINWKFGFFSEKEYKAISELLRSYGAKTGKELQEEDK